MILTSEQMQKAMSSESAEELQAVAKAEGITLTDEEAEAYFAELNDVHVNDDELDAVAGGKGKCNEKECGHMCRTL